jgi:hypothetical protein
MNLETLLADVNAVPVVTGCFLIGGKGQPTARAIDASYDTAALESVGKTIMQSVAGIERTRRHKVGDIDRVFELGRLLVKPIPSGYLAILCSPRVNASFLNLAADAAVRSLQQALAGTPGPSPSPQAPRSGELARVVAAELGVHSAKALEILAQAGDKPDDLALAVDEIEAMTHLFIDRKMATAIGERLRAILAG